MMGNERKYDKEIRRTSTQFERRKSEKMEIRVKDRNKPSHKTNEVFSSYPNRRSVDAFHGLAALFKLPFSQRV